MAATFQGGITVSLEAAADLNSYQYHFVRSAGTSSGSCAVNVSSGASNPGPIGVLQNDPNADQAAEVMIFGTTQLYVNAAGGTIVFGQQLKSASDGHGEASGATAASPVCHAISLGYTTADGVIIEAICAPWMWPVSGS